MTAPVVEADDHRHSSPCDFHKGKCINPYHIHDDSVEADKELDKIFAPIQEEYDGGDPMLPGTIPQAKELLKAWRDKQIGAARIRQAEDLQFKRSLMSSLPDKDSVTESWITEQLAGTPPSIGE